MKQNKSQSSSKVDVVNYIDSQRKQLRDISLRIFNKPELAFEEYSASRILMQYMDKQGFDVKNGICDLETAFKASYGIGRPVIGILAEYDALPQLGHACGHNLIAASAVGTAVSLRPALNEYGGTVVLLGTPGEELRGGKVFMAERGAFSNLDVVMMVHPGVVNAATTRFLARVSLDFEFVGRETDIRIMPGKGINALDAMILAFAGINALRGRISKTARIHGIITEGGESPYIIPGRSCGKLYIRAEEEEYLLHLKEIVMNCLIGASRSIGTELNYKWGIYYAPLQSNLQLAQILKRNMMSLRSKVHLVNPNIMGSSDIGNVSKVVPTIHAVVSIAPEQVASHSPEFAQYASSEVGFHGLIDAAKSMAMTAIDLLEDHENLTKIKKEYMRI